MNLFFFILCLLFIIPFSVYGQNHKGVTFQAFITDSSGQPISVSNLTVNLKVLSPNNCILMEENHSSINVSNGYLNLVVGKGTRAGSDKGLTFKQIFSNTSARSGLDPTTGTLGSCTYSPSVDQQDSRKLRIYFVNGADPIQADFNLRSSVYAVHAENAELLSGKTSADFVQTSANITQAKVESLLASGVYDNLMSLNSTNTGAVSLPSGTSAQQPGSPSAGMIRYNSSLNQVEYFNGSTWSPLSSGGSGEANLATNVGTGGVGLFKNKTSVTLNFKNINAGSNKISITDDTVNDEVKIDVNDSNLAIASSQVTGLGGAATKNIGTTAGTVAAGDDSRITGAFQSSTSLGGDLSGTLPNPTIGNGKVTTAKLFSNPGVNRLVATDASDGSTLTAMSCSSGQLLKWTASGWACASDLTGTTPGEASYGSASKGLVAFDTDASTSGVVISSGLAKINAGTSANQLIKLDSSARLPAVDGSLLTGLSANSISTGTLAVSRGGTAATSFAANALILSNGTGSALTDITCSLGQILKWSGTSWGCSADSTGTTPGDAGYGSSNKGLVAFSTDEATSGITVASGIASINTGTAANQIVKLNGSAQLPAVDGSLLTNLSATALASGTLPIVRGGTNSATALNNNRLMISSSGSIVEAPAMTNGQIIVGSTGAAPQVATLGSSNGISLTTGAGSLSIATNATSTNTVSTLVSRDASGNFSAGAITNSSNILKGSTSGTLTMSVPLTVTSYTLTWPNAVGAAGTFLSTDASGNLSWASPSVGNASYSSKGSVQGLTDAATSGLNISSGVISVNTGTAANQIVKLDSSARLPAMDGSQLTNLSASNIAAGTLPVARGGTGTTSLTANGLILANSAGTALTDITCSSGQVLKWNGSAWACAADSTGTTPGDAGYGSANKGLVAFSTDAATSGIVVSSGLANVNAGTSANQIVKLDSSAKLPAVDGSALTNLSAGNIASGTLSIARGGTGATSFTANALVMTNGTGSAQTSMTCSLNEILKWNGTSWACASMGSGGTAAGSSGQIQFNSSNSFAASSNLIWDNTNSRLGIGTTSPSVGLDVRNQIRSVGPAGTVYSNSGTSIDWNNGNTQITTSSCAAMTFSNMQEGGTYTLIVTGTSSGTCTFSQSSPDTLASSVFKFVPANTSTTASSTTVFTFIRGGNIVYVSWVTGY